MHLTTGTCVYMLTPGVTPSLLLPALHTSSSLPLTNTHALYKKRQISIGRNVERVCYKRVDDAVRLGTTLSVWMKPAGPTHPCNKIKRRVCVRHFCCYYGNGPQSYVRIYLGIPFHAASLPHLSGLNPSSSSRKTLLLVTVLSGLGMMRNLRTVPLLEPRNRTVLFLEGPASVSTTILFNWYLKEKPKQNIVSAAQSCCCWKLLFFFF